MVVVSVPADWVCSTSLKPPVIELPLLSVMIDAAAEAVVVSVSD